MEPVSTQSNLPTAPDSTTAPKHEAETTSGFALFARLIRFQIKLFLDGLRDLLLSPISIGAVILGFIFSPRYPQRFYNSLMSLGRKSDRWINLFEHFAPHTKSKTVDEYLAQVEEIVRKDHAAGGVSAKTQDKVNGVLNKIRRSKP